MCIIYIYILYTYEVYNVAKGPHKNASISSPQDEQLKSPITNPNREKTLVFALGILHSRIKSPLIYETSPFGGTHERAMTQHGGGNVVSVALSTKKKRVKGKRTGRKRRCPGYAKQKEHWCGATPSEVCLLD